MPRVLHVGCGHKTIAGMPPFFRDGNWTEVRLDIDPDVRPDIIGTITDLAGVATASVDAVFSSHNIEHVYPHEAPTALAEFHRVLSPNGFALITCPDLQEVARIVADDKLMEPVYQSGMGPISPIDIMFGHRASVMRGNHFMAHKGGFTLRSLTELMKAAGFRTVGGLRRPPHFDLWVVGFVARIEEEQAKALAVRLMPR